MEHVTCPKEHHPILDLKIGLDLTKKAKFIPWKCAKGDCEKCGIENKLEISKCPILSNCEKEIEVQVWDDVARSGTNSKGVQNTERELVSRTYPVKKVVQLLVDSLEEARLHYAEYSWIDHARLADIIQGDGKIVLRWKIEEIVILTDFSATARLRALKARNCSVDNHANLAIYYIIYNWREAKIKTDDGEMKTLILSDCGV